MAHRISINRDVTKTSLLAYDPASGDNVWNYAVDSPDQFLISEEMDRMILLSAQEEGRKVEALDILTGNVIWSRELPATAFSSGSPDYHVAHLRLLFLCHTGRIDEAIGLV